MLYKWHWVVWHICLMVTLFHKVFFQASHQDRLHFSQDGDKWHCLVSAPVSVGVPPQGAAAWYSGFVAVGASSPQLASSSFPYLWFFLLSCFFSLPSSRHGQSAVKYCFSLQRLWMSPVLLQTAHANFACFANEQKIFHLLNRPLKMYFWSLFFLFFCFVLFFNFLRSKLFLNLVQTSFLLNKYWYNIW